MRNMLLTSNNTATAVTADGTVALGSAVHGYGKTIKLNNNTITINSAGYYDFLVNASIAVTGTGSLTLSLYENGLPISGASATATPSDAAAVVNLTIPWVVRKSCCADARNYTIVSSAAGTVNNVTVCIEEVR